MNTGRRRSALSYIPGLTNNAVLKLIIGLMLGYVLLSLIWGVMLLVYQDRGNFNIYFLPNLGLPVLSALKSHWWTLLTYGWLSYGSFWELVSNMLWLYCFGSVVQMMIGPKQVIPMFAYSLLAGGLFYTLTQFLPGGLGKTPPVISLLGPRAGLIGLAAAAVTITPGYRFYITETFTIPLMLVAGIFGVLMLLGSGFYLPVILMLVAGGGSGFVYIRLLKAGYRPGQWIYNISDRVESLVTPSREVLNRKNSQTYTSYNKYEPKSGVSQQQIDIILDKINQKGYNSLTKEERQMLFRAGKE